MTLSTIVNTTPTLLIGTEHQSTTGTRGIYVAQIEFNDLVDPAELVTSISVLSRTFYIPTYTHTFTASTDAHVWTSPPTPCEAGFRFAVTQFADSDHDVTGATGITLALIVWQLE